jgi:putative endonuclease
MFYLYILRNKETDRFYIGSTNNLGRRLEEHQKGKTRTTRILKINELVYFEEYSTEKEARDREKKLKSYKSKKYIKWLID